MIPPRPIRRLLAGCVALAPLLTALPAAAQDFGTDIFGDNTDGFGRNTITPPFSFEEVPPPETTMTDVLRTRTDDARTPLVLEADAVTYDTGGRIARAVGEAEAFYGDRALGADALVYDAENGVVSAEGAVALRNDDGTLLFADGASLATDLTRGTIDEPRLLIEGGGKLAAVSGERVDGRYTVLSKAVYSACDVCLEDPTPLWRVRADRVIHDEVSRDIIYQDATFDVEGVSVFYLPYFRHPDPSVERRTGFLTPEFSRDETIGATLKTPYFINLAPNRDLTVTPYVMTKDGLILEAEYRAWTEAGRYRLEATGTVNNTLGDGDEFRGALNGEGLFRLDGVGAEDWYAGYGVDLASDDTYLRRYDYSNDDRTTSRAFVGKQTDRLFTETSAIYFQSFRPGDDSGTIPVVLPEVRYSNRLLEDPVWGTATVEAGGVRLEREDGRDYNRIGTEARWQRPFVTDPGVLVTPFASAKADLYLIEDDPVLDENTEIRVTGTAGLDIRYPLVARGALGTHVVEPIVQLVAAPRTDDSDELPNEDSLDTEFDETSLFSLDSRFPGEDRFEGGSRANIGVRYTLENDAGLGVEAVYGRVVRLRDNTDFSASSGLRDEMSDHVGSIRLTLPPYFDVTHRFRIDSDDGTYERNELYAQGAYGPVRGGVGYVFLNEDPLSGFAEDREEIYGNAAVDLGEEWTLYGSARADLEEERFVFAGGGVKFENECCAVDLSVKRRFNDDRDANDDTSVGLTVRLKSLGG